MRCAIELSRGGPARGCLAVQGSKNAAMALLAAAALSPPGSTISNIPDLSDVRDLVELLVGVGVKIARTGDELSIEGTLGGDWVLPSAIVGRFRGSVYASAVAFVVHGRTILPDPGGDKIAGRNLEPHLNVFRGLGATVRPVGASYLIEGGAPRPGHIYVNDKVAGITASCLALMLASVCNGQSTLSGISHEPEVEELAAFLTNGGAEITFHKGDAHVAGPIRRPSSCRVSMDRIVWGTYATAAALSGGAICLPMPELELFQPILDAFRSSGVVLECTTPGMIIRGSPRRGISVTAGPHPNFPSDLGPIISVLMAAAPGVSHLCETVYPSRFDHIPNLVGRGLKATVTDNSVWIRGGSELRGGGVESLGIRETMALLLSGLISTESVRLNSPEVLARGYDRLEPNLASIGLSIHSV